MKSIKGFEGLYSVTESGDVVSHKGSIDKVLTGGHNGKYKTYSLRKDGVQTQHLGHRLVADAYLPNVCGLPQVNHIDGNKKNNAVANLEWVSAKANMKHSVENGLWTAPTDAHYKMMREKAGKAVAKFTKAEADCIKAIYKTLKPSCRKLAELYGCSKATIQRIVNGTQTVFKEV